ncbi:unnamed protein product [Prorocentrum cordatum]|uniref:BEACH domain-containing protein n=1 Tax=Prorocentrum cordatum TaxID=2364126 RepID=A0ABN9VQM1_9DINO|nr:unnamed protein product [Polarella glacialis]
MPGRVARGSGPHSDLPNPPNRCCRMYAGTGVGPSRLLLILLIGIAPSLPYAPQDLSKVGHVELPAWARDAYHFVHEHHAALESAPVSRTLHGWIDLIWGCKQTGPAARDALNVFYPLTYEDGVDWDQVEPVTRHSKEQQVLHFGQTPRQLFQQPHPPREVAAVPTLLDPQGRGGCRRPGAAVALWHSSAAPAQPQSLGVQSLVRVRGLQLQAPVVAIGAAPAAPGQGGASRLQVVRADGLVSFYRVRLRQGGESGGGGGQWPGVQVDPEAAFYLPSIGGPLQWLFLSGPAEAQLLSRAHAASVSALAASSESSQILGAYGLLMLAGSLDGEVCLWAASDWEWRSFACAARWQPHLAPVRGVDFGERLGLALSCGDDGLVHVYRLRPPTRLLRGYRFQGGLPATEARFAAGVPAAVVACSAEAARVCVWALAGFLLASLDLAAAGPVRGLRVVSEGDGSREGLLVALGADGAGKVELRTLPYLQPTWRLSCQWGMPPCALDCRPGARGAVWLGHEDGTFGAAVVAAGGPPAGSRSAACLT